MSLNKEKQQIIEQDGNVLVTANPGTGKTRLLAYRYTDLIKKGISPDDILCLTFTDKAKREMERRILEVVEKKKIKLDVSKLNVYTFHSYALDNIEDNEILSTNLLRYAIFDYLKKNEVLNYGDEYLIDTIVPKMENLLRYLKSYGIMPYDINIKEVKLLLEEDKKNTKEELDKFAEYFIEIFKYYEEIKNKRGVDYSDLLIKFLKIKEIPQFEYVLVDELQDVNVMEADIALRSGKNVVAVGDKKQAIFGFQGGSILNFEKFKDSKKFVLSENFRSTDEVLSYAREYFVARTEDDSHKAELRNLKSAEGMKGKKPIIYDVERKDIYAVACTLAKKFKGKTAIIARTNYQIMDISREMEDHGLEFSSTHFSASDDAKSHIVNFLRGVMSNDIQDVKNSMFTPFFPISLQEAFTIADAKHKNVADFLKDIPVFRQLRESIKTVEDVNVLFSEKIIPISLAYGKEYLSAAVSLQQSFIEALKVLSVKNSHSMMSYLLITDLLSQDTDSEKDIVLITVHKAKGKEFDNVIYLPSKNRDKTNFQDKVVEGILKSKGINADEELEEETLRVNFVAFTRAKKNLVILTDKVKDYLNDSADLGEVKITSEVEMTLDERKKRAYDLFVNKQYDEAKSLLENKDEWIKTFVKNYFDSLEHLSFTSLPESAYQYFKDKILGIREFMGAANLGSEVHDAAEKLLRGEKVEVSSEAKPFFENVKKIFNLVKNDYPSVVEAEFPINMPLKDLGFGSSLMFKGFIDAVFRNGDQYLILDWKTDKNEGRSSKHRQQLETYRRAYSKKKNIPIENIKVAIGFVGLRTTINTGKIDFKLDDKQPAKSAFDTFTKKVEKMLSWVDDVDVFFEDFIKEKINDNLWRSVVEEYERP
jgi:DNA helicase II / ATP-dependent DNA helicase PcrA